MKYSHNQGSSTQSCLPFLVSKHLAHSQQMHFYRGRQVMLDSEESLKSARTTWLRIPQNTAVSPHIPVSDTGLLCQCLILHTYPSSAIPSMNSSFVNSHCVAARNFHAMMSTVMLAGSRARSSQNCCIPSIPILFSSWGSLGYKSIKKNRFLKKLIYSTRVFNNQTFPISHFWDKPL